MINRNFEVISLEDRATYLKNKMELLKRKQEHQRQDRARDNLIENIENFYDKYRFANDSEISKIEQFIGQLHFLFLGHIINNHKSELTEHQNMYLCFLCGTGELLQIYIYGNYYNFLLDIDNWDFFSPYLLLIDEDFLRYIYINDCGEQTEYLLQ